MSFFNELKRRNVFRVGIAYAVATWVLIQIADILLDNFGAPTWVMKSLVLVLAIGFFVALFFAWAFEMTPEGVKRESEIDRSQSVTQQTGQKLNFAIYRLAGGGTWIFYLGVTVCLRTGFKILFSGNHSSNDRSR